jgi:hypothetical protein
MTTHSFASQYGLPARLERWMIIFPVLIIAVFAVPMCFEATQDYAFALVKENNVVEWLTFAAALSGGVAGLKLAIRAGQRRKTWVIWLFYLVFALGLIFVAGEEVAWGQDFYRYRTPVFFQKWNEQGDVTFHNFEGWNGKNHFLRLAFGVGGLIGLRAWTSERFRDIAPPTVLRLWFWVIVVKSVLDFYVATFPPEPMPAFIISQLSEVVELLVAMAGAIYFWLNGRRLARAPV